MEDSPINRPPGALDDLRRLVKTLRGDQGCPWDKKQTPESVGIYLIEEVFELFDAIESGSSEQICEELGDVLFHIVFIARMFEEIGDFDLSQVARSITKKMIRRHPHVFGNKTVENWADVSDGDIEVIQTDGKRLVVVQRTDLDLNDGEDTTARELAYYDNRSSEVSLDWDAEVLLADLNSDVPLDDFFREEELDTTLAKIGISPIFEPIASNEQPRLDKKANDHTTIS